MVWRDLRQHHDVLVKVMESLIVVSVVGVIRHSGTRWRRREYRTVSMDTSSEDIWFLLFVMMWYLDDLGKDGGN